ncbi:unnamed protein product [Amoebophrya sp. A25]|nr:unnamed protein product [Amoebophrya sp. A25]|eukprot:GSA25T00022449001.1
MAGDTMNASSSSAPAAGEVASPLWTPVGDIEAAIRSLHDSRNRPRRIPLAARRALISQIKKFLVERAPELQEAEWADLRRPKPYHDIVRGNCVATCDWYLNYLSSGASDDENVGEAEANTYSKGGQDKDLIFDSSTFVRSETTMKKAPIFSAASTASSTSSSSSSCGSMIPSAPAPGSRAEAAFVREEAKGVALVIGTWNFPLPLHIKPLVTAIAAGCPVVLKLNEICHETSCAMQKGLKEYVDENFVRTVFGAVEHTTELLRHRFGHIFYTGNTFVGRIIYKAAAEHLTPVTLELGGKNPVIILPSANLRTCVRKLVDAKIQNVGQFCVSPDHVYLPRSLLPEFRQLIRDTCLEFLGENPQASPRYARLVSRRHFERVHEMLKDAMSSASEVENLAPYDSVSSADATDRYIAPSFLLGASASSKLRREEVFGPLAAVNVYDNLEEDVLDASSSTEIRDCGEPLALYVFGDTETDKENIEAVLSSIRSGGVAVNDCIVHMLGETLPFGGVGTSGFGSYRGDWGYRSFTHERAVMQFHKDDLHPRLAPA